MLKQTNKNRAKYGLVDMKAQSMVYSGTERNKRIDCAQIISFLSTIAFLGILCIIWV